MKMIVKGLSSFLAISLLLAIVLCSFSQSVEAKEDDVVTAGYVFYPPWMNQINGRHTGFDCEMLEELFGRMGKRVEFVHLSFGDMLANLKTGKLDIASSLLFREERNKYIRYVSPAYRTKDVLHFYARSGSNIEVKKYIDIAGLRVGFSRGANFFPTFDLDDRMIKVPCNSQADAFTKLADGKVDLVICSEAAGTYLIKELSLSNDVYQCEFEYAPKLQPSYIGVSRNSKIVENIEEINSILKLLKESGELDKIARKYDVNIN